MSVGVRIRPDFDDRGDTDRPPPKESTVWIAVAVIVVLALFGAMLWLVFDTHRRGERLEDKLAEMAMQSQVQESPFLPVPTTVPPRPLDLRSEEEREADRLSSIQIVDTINQLFDPNQPPGGAATLMAERPEVAGRLGPLFAGKCRNGRPVVTDVLFTDRDNAVATYWFDGVEMARGFTFSGGYRRIDGRWLAMPDAVENVAGTAEGYCLSGCASRRVCDPGANDGDRSGDEAAHRVGDAGWLVGSLDLDGDPDHHLHSALHLVDADDLAATADPAVDTDRRWEPHLVEPDVHPHGRAVHGEELRKEQVDQRQREVAVGDGCAVGGLRRGPLDVDVDPLVVARGVGEQVDLVLGDPDPVGRPEVGPVEVEQL